MSKSFLLSINELRQKGKNKSNNAWIYGQTAVYLFYKGWE